MQNENWASIKDFENYEVSNLGSVRRVRHSYNGCEQIYNKSVYKKNRYPSVGLWSKKNKKTMTMNVHYLIAVAFHGNRPTIKHHACHKNGNCHDNRSINIYWGTAKENAADTIRHGTRPRGKKIYNSKLTDEIVFDCRKREKKSDTVAPLSREYNVSNSTMWNAIRGITWQHV